MFYIPELNIAHCHIPRTGGTALTDAVEEAFPSVIIFNNNNCEDNCHQPSKRIRIRHKGVKVFAVIRNPWKIWESNYGWGRRFINITSPFDEYIIHYIKIGWPCKAPGFHSTFLDDDVQVFRYEDNPHSKIEKLLGRPLDNRITNETIHEPPTWTPKLIDLIYKLCSDDIERYGYTPHAEMKL